MTDTFLKGDLGSQTHELVELLYKRLDDCIRASEFKVEPDDEFNLGINCRIANELNWIQSVLDIVERS